MRAKQPKKLLIMNILDILRRYSDADHRLSQKDILDILQNEYEMDADRKAIKRNLMNLIDFGYHLEYSQSVRRNKHGEEEVIYTDWYLERDFSDAELRLLIDSLLFSKHIPYSQCKKLIEKIQGLSSRYFKSKVRHVRNLPSDQPQNAELFYTIEILDEAIERNRQVVFHYGDYGIDKKLRLRQNKTGEPRNYLVNPYQMVATNGRYYLIANTDKHNNISHYRLDRIRDIELRKSPAKPQRKVEGLENGLNLPKHMAEHIYMFSGESQQVIMRTTPDMAGELIDWFGNGVIFTDETETSVIAHVKANLQAMRFWALQYAPYVTILSPQSLADKVKEALRDALKRYEKQSIEK
ncbi:MAG: helix-turn-helix transcriptional regulator [Christensenellales bacterium]|jgi:predicted DNA-binding transcriptional regulator YafY